ncbi:sel1 repeat family protein [Stenotrophomonas sp. ATCM1_4]|uniref:sel1 repeat family protein n=1 Tax=Stenotrophomonas sp. ATCM1_4 TaxID=2259330 RepID=UPI0010442DAC|nr:sel1 repeat family protein [Stenotrophomonas sp. ATCM1_4]TDB27965.1 sel1 repeat family protein [Stenotrophomonas sp. ATCM1_4]
MSRKNAIAMASLLLTVAITGTAHAGDLSGGAPDPTEDQLMITAGFLNGHPDLRFRLLGLEKHKAGDREKAFRYFQYASFYGDKPSQGMVAEMLWTGVGTAQNRPLAYAWMDLAAERGYEGFAGLRERYWNDLSEPERADAIALGQEIYARYGDAAALPRIATKLRRERRGLTGSRTGFAGNVRIIVPTASGSTMIDGSKFYDERYWDPEKYQQWQDSVWMKPRIGTVNVGTAEQIPANTNSSRIPTVAPLQDAPEPDLGTEMPRTDGDPTKP